MDRLEQLANLLLTARRSGRAFVAAADAAPASAEEACRVQDRVADVLFPGERRRAWKVGAPRHDLDPTASPIHPALVLDSPATWTRAPVTGLSIEAEVAFRLSRDIVPGDLAALDVAAAFDRVMVSIEICDARMSNHRETSSLWKLADSQVNAGLVLGTGRAVVEVADYTKVRCEVRIDDKPLFDGVGRHSLGDPRVLLPWWIAHATRRRGLRAGDVVTTGSWCGMLPVKTGSAVVANFDGIGTASVGFAF
jgi:2-keto-4-pentenoate hydratase